MKIPKIALGIVAALLFVACKDTVDFKKTKGGVAYKIFPGKSKDSIAVGNVIKYHMIQTISNSKRDTVVFTSYDGMPRFQDVRPLDSSYLGALSEILLMAHPGDSIYFEQAVDSFIARQPEMETSTPFRKGDRLRVSIKILGVFKSPQEAQEDYMKERAANSDKLEEQALKDFNAMPEVQQQMSIDAKIIEDYLKANNIQARKSPWGAYVQVINEGEGPKPSFGKHLSIKYAGYDLEGAEFESGVFPLQFGTGASIKGFEEAVRFLGKGGKAKVFVPSMLGYGPQGREPKIKPNQILVFDIELLDMGDTPPLQSQAPVPDGSHEGHNH